MQKYKITWFFELWTDREHLGFLRNYDHKKTTILHVKNLNVNKILIIT